MQQLMRIAKVAIILAILAAVALAPSVGQAQGGVPGVGGLTLTGESISPEPPYELNEDGTITLLVQLTADAASIAYADELAGGATEAAAEEASEDAVLVAEGQQNTTRGQLAAMGITELYSVQHVLNGMMINARVDQIDAIKALPNVKSVEYAPRHFIDNSTSVPFITANQVWMNPGLGVTGDGVTIGIVDTGLDYLHRNMAGSANYASQTSATTMVDTGGFPQGAVINGTDLVGDLYGAGTNPAVPDPDPTDCGGHGSHVTGSAAGRGVIGGNTYAGSYDSLTAGALAAFQIGPGAAPEADVIIAKVFGCTGSTAFALQGFDWVVTNGADVVNMSLGSSYGFDGWETAITNASNAGVIVVISAGNSADVHYVHGSPASTTESISVANINDIGQSASALLHDADGGGPGGITSYVAIAQTYPNTPTGFGIAPPVQTLLAPPAGTQPNTNCSTSGNPALNYCTSPVNQGCDALNYTGFPVGAVAYVQRGTCSGKLKVMRAENAGASAVVIVSTGGAVALANDVLVPDSEINIPSVMISSTAGALINPSIGTATGQISEAGPNFADHMSGSSSRGPRRSNLGGGTVLLKPDIAAPGSNILSTRSCYLGSCTGVEGVLNSGTSMAAPHVAGVMALMRQLYPTYTVAELKALVMNTANHNLFETNPLTGAPNPSPASLTRGGAGRIDAAAATTEEIFAYNASNPYAVSVAWATDVLNSGPSSQSQIITVKNKESYAVNYNLSITNLQSVPGITFSVFPTNISVGGYSTGQFTVTVNYTPSAMTHVMDPNSLTMQNNLFRHWLTEASAHVYLDAQIGATVDLRVPLYSASRPASNMDSPSVVNTGAATGLVSVPLTGVDVNNGAGTALYRSRVSAFQLLHTDPEIAPGYQPFDGGDIQYVGASSDTQFGGGRTYFALHMYGDWDTPRLYEDYICMDLNQDGTGGAFGDGTDYCLYLRTNGTQTGGVLSDAHVVQLWDINNFIGGGAGALYSVSPDNYQDFVGPNVADLRLFDSGSLVVSFGTSPLFWGGLLGPGVKYTGGNTNDPGLGLNFWVETYDYNDDNIFLGGTTDSTPTLTFDPNTTPLNTGEFTFDAGRGLPMVDDLNGSAFDIIFNLTSAGPERKSNMLFIHHYNQSGDRADVVVINAPPTVPTLLAPADTSTVYSPTAQANLDWTDSTGTPSGYQVQVDNNNDFSSPEANANTVGSAYTTPSLIGTYFWRVRSMDIDGAFSAWSTVWSYTMIQTATNVEPTGAASCAKMGAAVTFKIRSLINGHNYKLTIESRDATLVYMTRQLNTTFMGSNGSQINYKAVIYPINQVPGLVPPRTYAGAWMTLPSLTEMVFTVVDKGTLSQTQTIVNYNCSTGVVTPVSETYGPITNPLYNQP